MSSISTSYSVFPRVLIRLFVIVRRTSPVFLVRSFDGLLWLWFWVMELRFLCKEKWTYSWFLTIIIVVVVVVYYKRFVSDSRSMIILRNEHNTQRDCWNIPTVIWMVRIDVYSSGSKSRKFRWMGRSLEIPSRSQGRSNQTVIWGWRIGFVCLLLLLLCVFFS